MGCRDVSYFPLEARGMRVRVLGFANNVASILEAHLRITCDTEERCSKFFEYFPLATKYHNSAFLSIGYIPKIFAQNVSQTKQFRITLFLQICIIL